MALGYCKGCDRLVGIIAREPRAPGTRERNWYPVAHAKQEHDRCGGAFVDDECNRCGVRYGIAAARGAITLKPSCTGIKRPV